MIIAVDGPTASGKGTLSKRLAAHFGLPHLDSGLLYRAVGRQVTINGGTVSSETDALDATQFADELLADPILRSEKSGQNASKISAYPSVRSALRERQIAFANQPGGAVIDGRDIGTVIVPDADVKLFVIASVEARAMRRHAEMCDRGETVTLEAIVDDLQRRDERDQTRAHSPLIPAVDSHLIDTSHLSRDEAFAAALEAIKQASA